MNWKKKDKEIKKENAKRIMALGLLIVVDGLALFGQYLGYYGSEIAISIAVLGCVVFLIYNMIIHFRVSAIIWLHD